MVSTRTNRQRWIDKVGFYGPANRWPPEAVERAFEMRERGKTYGEIAIAVGRTPDAVAARLRAPRVHAPRVQREAQVVQRAVIKCGNDAFVQALRDAGGHVDRPVELSSFEQKLARVAAGASITELRPFNRRATPEMTLAGVGSRWMA